MDDQQQPFASAWSFTSIAVLDEGGHASTDAASYLPWPWTTASGAQRHRDEETPQVVWSPQTSSLEIVLANLGPILLELLLGDPSQVSDIDGIVIYDAEEVVLPRRAIILAVAAHSSADVVAVLDRAGETNVGAVVVRSPLTLDHEIRTAVDRTGVVLLGLTRGASWTQLAFLLCSMLGLSSSITADRGADPARTDLFALANVLASLLEAPITIEDRNSQVLAFSGGQDEVDQARIDTIVGRQVPHSFTRAYQAQGIFRQLYRQHRPVYVESETTEVLPRVAVAIRAGNEVLGSIWAVHGQMSPEREETFIDGAKLAALHMLRQTVASDITRRLQSERVMVLLEGGPGVEDAARALGLNQPAVVWAWGFPTVEASLSDAEAERQRVLDALTFHVSPLHPWAGVAVSADRAYVVLPVSTRASDAEADSVRIAQTLLNRTAHQFSGRIGVSRVAATPADIVVARQDADRALRVLQRDQVTGVAGGITRLGVDALLLELNDLAKTHRYQPTGPIARLLQYDAEKGTELIPTTRVWLDHFGDVGAAAAAMQVHTNTFRYRLRRVLEVGQIDPSDLTGRFALMVQLRLLEPSTR